MERREITEEVIPVIADMSQDDRTALETELEDLKAVLHSAQEAVREAHDVITYPHLHPVDCGGLWREQFSL